MVEDLAIIFAYHFPPENTIGARRPYRFYKYLTRMGYRCYLITAAEIEKLGNIEGRTVPDPFVANARQGFGWQLERAVRKFLLPGVVGTQWAMHAYRAAIECIENNPGARVTVISTFPPVGVHLAAYWLARRRRLPWIADYRDPLADNPVYDIISPFSKSVYRRLEKIFVEAADISIANTDSAQDRLKREYPRSADRIQVIWNGFDPEERLRPLPYASTDRKVIAHVGELYGGRKITPLLESLRRLVDGGRLSPADFQIYLAGPMVPNCLPDPDFINNAVAEGWLRITNERMPQKQAHEIMQTANALALVQWQSVLQVPAKLYEYLQIGRPILAMVPQNSPVERILSRSGVPYRCVYPTDVQEKFDNAVYEFVTAPQTEAASNEWFETHFNAVSQAQKLSELIQAVHGEHVPAPVVSEMVRR